MKKRILAVLMSLLMVVLSAAPAFAASTQFIFDDGGNISAESEAALNDQAEKIYKDTGVAVLYADAEPNGESGDYLDKIAGNFDNCVAMIHNLKTNKVLTRAYGSAEKVIKEDEINKIFAVYNDTDTYKEGIEKYLSLTNKYLVKAGLSAGGSQQVTEPAVTEPADTESTEAADSDQDAVAETQPTEPKDVPDHRIKDRLVDDADLLTDEQEHQILRQLNVLSEEKQKDVVIYFTDHFDQPTVVQASDEYFYYNGFGIGPEREGIQMFVCMDTRDIYFTTHGPETIEQFSDSDIQSMVSGVGSYLSNENYVGACEEFMDDVEYYTVHHFNTIFAGGLFGILTVIGGIVGASRVSRERRKLVSVRFQAEADDYLKPGSYHCTMSQERFIRTDVNRVYDPLPDDDDRGGGGGSSTHSGPGGSSFGGGGGKF